MARSQINLNRFRKIYPQLRKSPVWWTRNTEGASESRVLGDGIYFPTLAFTSTLIYNSPVVIATAEGDDVNVWVESISEASGLPGQWFVIVNVSDQSYTGKIHVHIYEGNPS